MVSDTSAMLNGLRESVPLKMTSAISPPRRALADCSPSTQRMASDTLDLPQPFGPDDGRDARLKIQRRFIRKRFEPQNR